MNMAEAYGKLTGRPAAAMVTRGPGACHGAIGVHVAMQDSTPMLLFVGQIPFEETDRESFQEVDYRRMFGPLAKWVTQIDQAKRIPEIVAHAVDVATTGRPGPVVIALSEEMQKDIVEVPDLPRAPMSVAHPDPAALARMRALLAHAKKPLALLGGSCWSAKAARRSAISCSATACRSRSASGARRCMTARRNFAGDLGVGSDPALVAKVKEADLVLAIGTRLRRGGDAGLHAVRSRGRLPIVHVYPDARRDRPRVPPGARHRHRPQRLRRAAARLEPTRRPGPTGRRSCGRCARRGAQCPTTRAR